MRCFFGHCGKSLSGKGKTPLSTTCPQLYPNKAVDSLLAGREWLVYSCRLPLSILLSPLAFLSRQVDSRSPEVDPVFKPMFD
jgi:hypothetical protein